MSKTQHDIPSDLVTVAEAARILTAHGDQTSAQNLTRYCKRHGLVEQKAGRFLMVNPARIADHRDSFSREVMKGEHIKPKTSPKSKRASKKPPLKLAAQTTNPEPPSELDRARLAKAEKEEAQADRARLDLFKETRDLVSTAEMEVMIGLMMTLFNETLFGGRLSDDTEKILAINKLPDSRKKPTQAILKRCRREVMQEISDLAHREMKRLDPHHSNGFADRLKRIIVDVHTARKAELDAQLSVKGQAN